MPHAHFFSCPVNLLLGILLAASSSVAQTNRAGQRAETWTLGPFRKLDAYNPCLTPLSNTTFACPVRGETVNWEEKDVFNPAAVVREGKVYLIYRAEDTVGKHAGTSRIGLAVSTDGKTFTRQPKPVFYPDNDSLKRYEWEGGCEDPRVVETKEGNYVMTYTAYDGKTARLCVASSPDLQQWTKHGLAFSEPAYADVWSKSGSIVCRREGSKIIATRINGKYWMYWGDTQLFLATSPDLIEWQPVKQPDGKLLAVLPPRPGKFDSRLVEPGPPALLTKNGILLLYNSMNSETNGDKTLPAGTYAAGQALFDAKDPAKLLKRTNSYFMRPDKPYEITGQIGNVCFVEGLVHFQNTWLLYYGTADSKIAVAEFAPGKVN